ncbi:glycoside hydrolase family 3 C-terminal domain-containing protein, partial [Gordonia rhizosphera]
ARVAAAIESGTLAESDLDRACSRVIELARRVHAERDARGDDTPVDVAAHHELAYHELARRTAAAGTVLLTNDGLLPLPVTGRIALIGAFADHPRYQGSGSSLVNPTRCDTTLDALRARVGDAAEVVYAPGYDPVTGTTTPALIAQARQAAADADAVIAMVGLPGAHESEGFDRTTLRLPADLDGLVEVVVAANPRSAVVLNNGGSVEIGWADKPAALVEAYLGGQAGGSALVDVLVGDAEPGGRLAESFPVTMAELPAHENFPGTPTQVQYRETFNVGYRFYDTHDVAPRFCFGHGLSYTTFEHTDLTVTGENTDRTVSVTVTNTGDRPGSDVVQVYVHDVISMLPRPDQELKGFAKVHLEPGESRRAEIGLGRRAFAVFDVGSAAWRVEAGQFEIRVGTSSRDVRLTATIDIECDDALAPVPSARGPVATDAEFEVLLGHPIPTARPLMPFHEDSAIDDLREVVVGRLLRAVLVKSTQRSLDLGDDPGTRAMLDAVLGHMPLRAVVANSGGKLSFDALDKLLRVLNLMGGRSR